jgi:hypothetical protein
LNRDAGTVSVLCLRGPRRSSERRSIELPATRPAMENRLVSRIKSDRKREIHAGEACDELRRGRIPTKERNHEAYTFCRLLYWRHAS